MLAHTPVRHLGCSILNTQNLNHSATAILFTVLNLCNYKLIKLNCAYIVVEVNKLIEQQNSRTVLVEVQKLFVLLEYFSKHECNTMQPRALYAVMEGQY